MSDGTEPNFEEMLSRLLEKLMGDAPGSGESGPRSDNPEDYPRSIEITDDEAIMAFEKLAYIRRCGERKLSELRALKFEHDALKTRFFLRLEDTYEHIGSPTSCAGTGWRPWKGKTYYVGWDREERSLKNS